MKFYWLIIGTLAVWRLTHLLEAEDGPWDIIVRLRRRVGEGFWGKLLDCFYCLSIWIAAPAAVWIGKEWVEQFILWLAFSAGAILIERLTNHEDNTLPPIYYEDMEETNVLRKTKETD